MLRVLCSESELDEYGVVLAVGEHVSRPAARIERPCYGTDPDTVEWRFDQYADAVGHPSATISGTVTAISAVSVQLTGDPEGGWTARPGSAHLEPLDTTAATRRIEPVIDWEPPSPPDEDGHSYRSADRTSRTATSTSPNGSSRSIRRTSNPAPHPPSPLAGRPGHPS